MKLTKTLQEEILDEICKVKFSEKLKKAKETLHQGCYNVASRDAEVIKITKLISKFPELEKYIITEDDYGLYKNNSYVYGFRFDKHGLPYAQGSGGRIKIKLEDNPNIEKLYQVWSNLDKERDEFRKQFKQILKGYTTTNRLLKDIPECALYFEKIAVAAQNYLPVPIQQIEQVRNFLKEKYK